MILTNELSAQAYKQVRSMILSKELAPGQKIVQDRLAEELGISRTPLRSALQMLEGEGLVESIPRRGVIVKEFTDKEIIEVFDCRMALEGTAVRLFTDSATDEQIQTLKSIFESYQNGAVDQEAYQKADAHFHDSIIKGCGNSFLHRIFQQSNLLVFIDAIGLVRSSDQTLAEHNDIVNAIERRDPDLAEELIKKHLDISKQLIIQKING